MFPPQVSKWIQRYVRQLQRKALVYKQSFRRSTRRGERENTEQEKLEDARSLTDFTSRQRGLAFKESLESSDFESRGCYVAFVERRGSEDIG